MSARNPAIGEEPELTEREMKIAKKAADLAVEKIMNDFYKEVGKGVVSKALIVIGLFAVGLVLYGKVPLPWKP